MALIICPECGGKLSDKAEFCPHCGFNPCKQYGKDDHVDIEENSNSSDEYLNMTEKDLNLLIEQYIVKLYPQLFGEDNTLQQKECCKTLDNIFYALERLNRENELLLIARKYTKIPYLHLTLYLSTFQYIAISKSAFERVFDYTFSDAYEEIGLHIENMHYDFGKVLVLDEKYNDFVQFSAVYNKIRFKEQNLTQGDYIIYQYGSTVNDEFKLNIPNGSLHLGDFSFIDKEVRENTIEKVVWDSIPSHPKKSKASLTARAVVGGAIAGEVGAIVGLASAIEKNSKIQEENDNVKKYHIEYTNDDSYILILSSNIVWGANFSFLINNNRANNIKFDHVVYDKMEELYTKLECNMMLAQQVRQQMYAWVTKFNDITGFKENSDESLECLKSYDPNLYLHLMRDKEEKQQAEMWDKEEKQQAEKIKNENKKKSYINQISKAEKAISEWQNKYDLYKDKKFGEGKKMKEYYYSQLVKLQEEKKSLEEAIARLEDK